MHDIGTPGPMPLGISQKKNIIHWLAQESAVSIDKCGVNDLQKK
jgi:hypothetical protein